MWKFIYFYYVIYFLILIPLKIYVWRRGGGVEYIHYFSLKKKKNIYIILYKKKEYIHYYYMVCVNVLCVQHYPRPALFSLFFPYYIDIFLGFEALKSATLICTWLWSIAAGTLLLFPFPSHQINPPSSQFISILHSPKLSIRVLSFEPVLSLIPNSGASEIILHHCLHYGYLYQVVLFSPPLVVASSAFSGKFCPQFH